VRAAPAPTPSAPAYRLVVDPAHNPDRFATVVRAVASFKQTLSIPFQPLLSSARGYNLHAARSDAIAGLTVAVVAVPQCMAYAAIAGVPLHYGLYTVIFQSAIGSLFASQRFLSIGPINTQSLLVASSVTYLMRNFRELPPEQADALYLQLVFALTILKGMMQLGFSALRLGMIARFVSAAVVTGFTAGAAVLIAAGQIKNFLGIELPRHAGSDWPGLPGVVLQLKPHLDQINLLSVGLGVLALLVLLICQRLPKLVPGPLLATILAAVVVALAGWGRDQLKLVDPLPTGLDQFTFSIPVEGLAHWQALLGGALALSLLGLMEAYSIGKSLAGKTGERVNANQELFGQGLTNFVTGFLQCIPGSGSFSRSALNEYAGARTCFSGVFNALFVLIIMLLLARQAQYVPMSALAAILFVIAYGLVDWRYMLRLYHTSRADAAVCFATLLATLTLPLAYAVFLGVLLNIAMYVRQTSKLHIQEMVRKGPGSSMFYERPLREKTGGRRVFFLQIEGDLFFGVADELRDRFAAIEQAKPRVVIFRLKRTLSMDSTVLSEFERFTRSVQAKNGHVVLCGVKSNLMKVMNNFGLLDVIGPENVFESSSGIFASAKLALRRAAQLVGGSIDQDELDIDLECDEEDDPDQRPDNRQAQASGSRDRARQEAQPARDEPTDESAGEAEPRSKPRDPWTYDI